MTNRKELQRATKKYIKFSLELAETYGEVETIPAEMNTKKRKLQEDMESIADNRYPGDFGYLYYLGVKDSIESFTKLKGTM